MGKNRYLIKDVHEKTGLSRNTVSNLYNNKATRIDYETIEKLCNLFNESNIVKIVRFTDEDCVRNPIIPEILKTLRE